MSCGPAADNWTGVETSALPEGSVPLIDSLIAAVLKSNGDGLVMHVGERPYVLTSAGPTNLADRPMSFDAMNNVLADLLTVEDDLTLREVGAVEKDISLPAAPGEAFRLVAARGGQDIWVELRRLRATPSSTQVFVPQSPRATESPVESVPRPRMAPSHPEAIPAAPASPPPPVPSYTPIFTPTPKTATSTPSPAAPQPGRPASPSRPPHAPREPPSPVQRPTPAPRDVQPGVVLPLARGPIRGDVGRPTPPPPPRHLGVGRLLRTAAARGASSLYLMAEARPHIRVDDEMLVLDTEPPLSIPEVEALVLELAPSSSREAFAGGSPTEWVCDLPDVGRVRCLSFRDQRGPGAVFRLIPARLMSADQLGLSRDIQALCSERDGLILVAGPRLSGKSALVAAFVDLINRNRADYIITLESEIKFVHDNRKSMISQREVRGDGEAMTSSLRSALRENPDLLVVDDLRSPDAIVQAVDAADSGHLVIASVTAHTTMTAVARLIESVPMERQPHMALALAETLRGAVAQVLLRKAGGGRVAARELLLNTPGVSALLAEGKVSQLSLAIESGRKYGMIPMNDALAAFVQSGAVDAREAYRKAFDRVAFIELLRRDGVDTSFVERLA